MHHSENGNMNNSMNNNMNNNSNSNNNSNKDSNKDYHSNNNMCTICTCLIPFYAYDLNFSSIATYDFLSRQD